MSKPNWMKGIPITAASLDLTWMKGQHICAVTSDEVENWYFNVGKVGPIQVQCPWRILRDGKIVLSSDDHGQKFGLPNFIDAAKEATAMLSSAAIIDVDLNEGTLDLALTFENGLRLQVISLSRGYESWQINDPFGNYIVAQGQGHLTCYKQ